MMSKHNRNINREIKNLNQQEILELESTVAEMKNSLQ